MLNLRPPHGDVGNALCVVDFNFGLTQVGAGIKLPGMAGSLLLGKARSGLRSPAMMPFAAQQAMNMSTGESSSRV